MHVDPHPAHTFIDICGLLSKLPRPFRIETNSIGVFDWHISGRSYHEKKRDCIDI